MHIDVLGVCLQKVHPKMNRIEDPDENQLKADVASSVNIGICLFYNLSGVAVWKFEI